MSTAAATRSPMPGRLPRKPRRLLKAGVYAGLAIVLLVAMALGTRVVSADDPSSGGAEQFSAAEFASENYADMIKPAIIENAVPAEELAAAIAADPDAAGEEYGGRDGQSAWAFPVELTGVAGEADPVNGQLPVAVEGVGDVQVFVQMGAVVNGSALRDVTGEVSFEDFTNQIEFQSVSAELNNMVKADVLADIDPASLNGQTITVVGAFSLVNPAAWIVTPVQVETAG